MDKDKKDYIFNKLRENKIFCLDVYEQRTDIFDKNILYRLEKNPYINSYINGQEIKEGEGYCIVYNNIICKLINRDIFTYENNLKWGRI